MNNNSYFSVRRNFYREVYERELSEENINLYTWESPYTKLKSFYYIEIGAIFIFFLLKTNITPNAITLFYAGLGLIGCALFAFNSQTATIVAIIIFFSKSIPDWIDGHIARIQNKSSTIGAILDEWGAVVNVIAFKIGVCIYLSHTDYYYLFFGIIILLFDAIDFRKYFYMMVHSGLEKISLESNKSNKSSKNSLNLISFLTSLTKILHYNGRSAYTDLVLLIIIIELFTGQIIFSILFAWIWLIISVAKFFYTLKIMFNSK